jgi:hypothetical protein
VGMKHTWEKIYGHAAHMGENETHITDEICGTHERD